MPAFAEVHAGPRPARSNLATVSLLGRKKETEPEPEVAEPAESEIEASRRTTAPKGRPTPKRDAAKRRGPVTPAPMTGAEARKRRKELRGSRPELTRDERKALKNERRADMADRREKMMAGDEGFLLPRDKGPVRRYARDIVDSRRNLLGLFMPAALGLIFVMLAMPIPVVTQWSSPAMLVLAGIMTLDGFVIGRKVNKMVDAKFPDHTEGRWKLGFYAASRASQLRRMRAPRPKVKRGESVT